jgi:hypothetical protein
MVSVREYAITLFILLNARYSPVYNAYMKVGPGLATWALTKAHLLPGSIPVLLFILFLCRVAPPILRLRSDRHTWHRCGWFDNNRYCFPALPLCRRDIMCYSLRWLDYPNSRQRHLLPKGQFQFRCTEL